MDQFYFPCYNWERERDFTLWCCIRNGWPGSMTRTLNWHRVNVSRLLHFNEISPRLLPLDHWHWRSASAAPLSDENEERSHAEVNSTESIQLVFLSLIIMSLLTEGISLCEALVMPQVYVYEMKENVMVCRNTCLIWKGSRAIMFDIFKYLFENTIQNLKYGQVWYYTSNQWVLQPSPPPRSVE